MHSIYSHRLESSVLDGEASDDLLEHVNSNFRTLPQDPEAEDQGRNRPQAWRVFPLRWGMHYNLSRPGD